MCVKALEAEMWAFIAEKGLRSGSIVNLQLVIKNLSNSLSAPLLGMDNVTRMCEDVTKL